MIDIYLFTNVVNSKKYVGQSIRGWETRGKEHSRDSRNGSDYPLHRAMRKYGEENFTLELIESVETLEEANLREDFWIVKLDTQNPELGYNLKSGGWNGLHSESTKEKMSISAKQNYIDHPELRAEKGNHWRGVPLSEERKQYLSEIHTGMKYPPRSEESKRRTSESLKKARKNNPWQTGASTPEHLQSLHEGLRVARDNTTPEDKEILSSKLREANKAQFSTEESHKKHSDVMKTWSASRTPEQKAESARKRKETLASKTPEEVEKDRKKYLASMEIYNAKKKLEETHA